MQSYCTHLREQYGIEFKLRWEDGVIRDLPQDVADMQGWEEMVQKVAKLYHSLSPEEKQTCHLLGGSYGHAGSLNYFRDKYNLPETMSLSSSYLFWAKKNAVIQTQIFVDERKHSSSDWFANMVIVDSIENKYARDPGYIHWRTTPKIDVSKAWFELVEEMQSEVGIRD